MADWSPQQEVALKAVGEWAASKGGPQVFRLFGFAGTGKTTLARQIAGDAGGKVLFGAFTGKAALMLRSKGCVGARTIHSLIYTLKDENFGDPTFVLNSDSEVKEAGLVIIDECSMVDKELGEDLLSFGTKVLVLGDPAQLPPVRGQGFFTNATPDIMLTEIHRQARDNPIIHMSMLVRENGRLDHGSYGESRVISRDQIDPDSVVSADQVLVGRNVTRHRYNDRIRQLLGRTNGPTQGDKLVCLRNNRQKGLLNGGLWNVQEILKNRRKVAGERLIKMKVAPIDTAGSRADPLDILVHPFFFEGRENELEWRDRRGLDEFDYGLALTVHKAQGSQWDNVVVFDESGCFGEDRNRHLYTALTRAAERVTVAQ